MLDPPQKLKPSTKISPGIIFYENSKVPPDVQMAPLNDTLRLRSQGRREDLVGTQEHEQLFGCEIRKLVITLDDTRDDPDTQNDIEQKCCKLNRVPVKAGAKKDVPSCNTDESQYIFRAVLPYGLDFKQIYLKAIERLARTDGRQRWPRDEDGKKLTYKLYSVCARSCSLPVTALVGTRRLKKIARHASLEQSDADQ